jgi:hypothetical protein
MKTFREYLSEKVNGNFVGFEGKAPIMVGYAAKHRSFIQPEPDKRAERSPFIDQHKRETPDPLDTRGKFHLYNKSSKQVTTQHPNFKKQPEADTYLSGLGTKSREHLEVVYHDKSGGWHKVNNGIMDPVSVKVLNKNK